MDSAYFVGRNEILGWINDRLQLNLSRIEEVIKIEYIKPIFPLGNFDFEFENDIVLNPRLNVPSLCSSMLL